MILYILPARFQNQCLQCPRICTDYRQLCILGYQSLGESTLLCMLGCQSALVSILPKKKSRYGCYLWAKFVKKRIKEKALSGLLITKFTSDIINQRLCFQHQ